MIEFTAAQRQAIGLHALDKDTCVVAGPGSGKTTVLIERFRGLVEAGVSPLRILAITFTEKATSQMRERLGRAFAGDAEVALQIQRAYVSTVHGFCTRLLRENAILAGVDPRFRVLNEQEALALERRSAGDALDGLLAEYGQPVRELLQSLRAPDLAESVLEICHALRAAGMSLAELEAMRPETGARQALDRMAEVCAEIARPEAVAEFGAWLRSRRGEPVSLDDFRILAAFNFNLNTVPRKDRDPIKRLRDEDLPRALSLLTAEYYAGPRRTLLSALTRFDALYRGRKADQSALDFSDLEEFSVNLLERNPEARARVRRQFDYILMDEFQDTNGLQSKLLDLLRPEDRFYAVGDINQSIYGFRYADPRVFEDYRRRIVQEGKHLAELRENWRSRSDILHAVTSLIGSAEGIERHSFQPARKFRRKAAASVEAICCLAGDAEQALELEARWVASRVMELRGALALERGPARFADMAVLVRKADTLQAFARAFDEAGIPYAVTAGKGFFEAREVRDLTHLLRALANPRDEISLAAVLRSPLVGATDAALFDLKQRGNLGEALESSGDPAVSAFARELARWREARHYVTADRLLIRAMDRAGYELALGPRERSNIEKFLALVREAGGRQSLDGLVEELEKTRESDPREQDAAAEDVGDVVRLMTIHAAKGLEFPVVFLPALQAGTSRSLPSALLSPRRGLGVRWRNPVTGHSEEDSLYAAIKEDLAAREQAEGNRLLYVAMTRAEEHLTLSCSGAGKFSNWAGYLVSHWNLTPGAPTGGWREERIATPDGGSFPLRVLCTADPPAPAQQLSLGFAPRTPRRMAAPPVSGQYDSAASVTSIALFAECPRRYYLARYLGWGGERPRPASAGGEDEQEREPLDSTEFGRQVHALLAGEPRDGASPEALALAARFEASEPGRRAAAASRIEREFDFLLALEDIVIRGQIDLWFEESGERVLVDYKTDDISAAEAAGRAGAYALQLQLYAIAAGRLDGRAPDRALLYFLRLDMAVPVDIAGTALERARGIVLRFRQAQESGSFPLNEGIHCRRCPFFRGMCPAGIPEAAE